MFSKRHSSGYTLIEVLVAMVILALALSVLLQIFSGGLRNISISDDYTRAVLIARTQLNSTGAIASLATGSSDGISDEKFHWTRTVENYAYSATTNVPLNAYTVTVEVEWSHAKSERRVQLSSLMLGEKNGRPDE